ncbi:SagB/ThcOx family dehydrogenase [Bradyrhizobium sp. IC4060]|nr:MULTISPECIES: SagB/ThcOx family dehydrogenase [unclassified Bradyrhizobium]MCA1373578.1 SagB/ThcOx family dehydrogenase [Bradyrhizobium sp. IC4060]MCA1487221.1 SagB/ThcOx family dehydrogenase [Bradyrhizobium sp. IC4061]
MTNVQPNFDLIGLGPFHFRARVSPHLPFYREAISRAEKGELSTPELVSRVVTSAFSIDQHQYDLLLDAGSSVKGPPLNVVLERRRSRRDFCGSLSLASLSKLLVEGLGLPRFLRGRPYAFEVRSYPSGGALFPIDVVVEARNVAELPAGSYFYDPRRTRLIQLADHVWSVGQSPFFKAAAVMWMIYSRSVNAQKYAENAKRLALIEAGHIGQNLLLVAESLDLRACPFLGQIDAPVVDFFESDAEAVYAIGVG